ncbi:MAG: MEDS domain-containing protein [Actinobacteria bacterium]|nr:MEDS domain-containing protein [Actinomycetota bacterium]
MVADLGVRAPRHTVQFYGAVDELTEAVGRYLCKGIRAGSIPVVIATPTHLRAFESRIESAGIDLASARRTEQFIALDAEETLSRFMMDGRLDPEAFDAVIGALVRGLHSRGGRAVAYGEMVALLWDEGNVLGALELEGLWNELLEGENFELFCAYPEAVFAHTDAEALHSVCDMHSEVVGYPSAHHRDPLDEAGGEAMTRTFACNARSAREARRFTRHVLEELGHGSVIEDVVLVAGELAANAVLHARSAFTLDIRSDGATIRLAVRDRSTSPPELAPVSKELSSSGRGLRLIQAVSSRWGYESNGQGKTVWAEFKEVTPDA